ncbi:hypothetical protein [Corynebacterium sanguinis]|nr:hypothetical protein [Corynebacterium sanguinis]
MPGQTKPATSAYIVDLIGKVTRVAVETVRVVNSLHGDAEPVD